MEVLFSYDDLPDEMFGDTNVYIKNNTLYIVTKHNIVSIHLYDYQVIMGEFEYAYNKLTYEGENNPYIIASMTTHSISDGKYNIGSNKNGLYIRYKKNNTVRKVKYPYEMSIDILTKILALRN